MMHPDPITTSVWDDSKNIDLLRKLHAEGLSYSAIAAVIGQGVTRNAALGKAKRMKLPDRGNTVRARPSAQHGNKNQPKAKSIVARAENRQRAAALANVQHSRNVLFREGSLPPEDGVDVTGLIAFSGRRIGRQCSWISGDPHDGAMCCGKPVKPGTEWCQEHHTRVFKHKGAR